jgi:C-terminal processing protease CtpA/Prc
MAIKAAWKLAILVGFVMTLVSQVRAGQVQAVTVPSSCNSWDGDLTIVAVDNRPVANEEDLRNALSTLQPDNTIYLTLFQQLPNGIRKAIKIAFRVGNKKQTVDSSSTITAEKNAPQSEDYYEMISGCVNCVIPGLALGGVDVQLLVNEDNSVAPPVKRGLFTVTAPAKDSPADQSGLRFSDQIVKINGDPVGNMTVMDAIKRLREPKGTDVTLTMARTVGPEESLTVTLPRW